MAEPHSVLIFGAGASLAKPAGLPLFKAIRDALLAPLELTIDERDVESIAPEALLSRLGKADLDIEGELRRMLGGGRPNALHHLAARVLARGGAVWTTNFDELIEQAAADFDFHRLLPDDDAACDCGRGHLVKIHGTLSATPLLAAAEDVLVPLDGPWMERLERDCADSAVWILGYAGADIDLRSGLRSALESAASAGWFSGTDSELELRRRFAGPLARGVLRLRLSERPDLDLLADPDLADLASEIDTDLMRLAREPINWPHLVATYRPNDFSRALFSDAFGDVRQSRRLFAAAVWRGPARSAALRSWYRTGLIHGAPWRASVIATFDVAARLPLKWRWPHLLRLPYLTWNLPPRQRLPYLERSLERVGEDPALLMAAGNAAKEVDPRRAVELGKRALALALADHRPADAAWATFVISLASRSSGDLDRAAVAAGELADGYGPLAGPNWVAWGAYETAAVAALRSELAEAAEQMRLCLEIFDASGSTFAVDAACAQAAIERARGHRRGAEKALAGVSERAKNQPSLRADFKRELLDFERAELLREADRAEEAADLYAQLAESPNLAQEILGLIGFAEVQRSMGRAPEAARRALTRSQESGFAYGTVHAALTLAFAGEIEERRAEELIRGSGFPAPEGTDRRGLVRFCQGPEPARHILCFPW